MAKKKPIILAAVVVAALLLAGGIALAQTGGGYDLSWNSIDGGGGAMSGGVYSLAGTVGQGDAGPVMSGGEYSLEGGFWNITAAPVVLHLPVQFRD